MTEQGRSGFSLIELLIVVAIIGIMVSVATPNLMAIRRGREVRLGASELRNVLQFARSQAVVRGLEIGVKFVPRDGRWTYGLYQDGDGDGIRNADITSGVDRRIVAPPSVPEKLSVAFIGLPAVSIYVPDSSDVLDPAEGPIRFGGSFICSFSPLGSGTPGSIYITDGLKAAAAVRVLGSSGRIRIVLCREAVAK
ncbi:MAG TPA: GspH/FimT family pseudopilin [Thermoanaerobaculia bacterium]|nr:GspH/FimT family pseudopilin [Thermoanaerobaculia bacterium]